ncbi:lipocalin family protein [Marinobacter fonticola]|uniref:lipocalin family protein n=1 Tax=Marinobacter fonticola TaxID=2603215 RepID=UPI001D0DBC08|nr:lipocalin family protein [Marinobacter fonticola]
MKHLRRYIHGLNRLGAGCVCLLLAACTGLPDRVEPVTGFEPQRYLGTWYEIARLPHPFEEGLSYVQATYTANEDGTIDVLNQGFNAASGEWEQANGVAKFVGERRVGHLKVSFFGPFYASYVVMALDKADYRYSLVTGPDRDYLWLLSRTPEMAAPVRKQLVAKAREAGYPVDDLIWVEQSGEPPAPRP